jgi:hypothetical protein
MRKLLLSLLLSSFAFPAYAERRHYSGIERRVHTYKFSLKTKDNRWISDTVTAESENDARRIIHYRYPGCIIYGVYDIN